MRQSETTQTQPMATQQDTTESMELSMKQDTVQLQNSDDIQERIEICTINKSKVDNSDVCDDEDWPKFDSMSFCYPLEVYKKDWKQIKNECLAGLIVSFAQIPEAVAFAFLAGVPPIEGLQASWIVGFITSIFGGRTSMISGATGAIAAVLATVPNRNHIYPIVIISGCLITLSGILNFSKFARLIPHSAMIGFLNGLAIIIAESQLHIFQHTHGIELILMIISSIVVFCIVYLLPRFTKAIPSSLVGILIAVVLEYGLFRAAFGVHTKVIGDLGELSGDMPTLLFFRHDLESIDFSFALFLDMLIPALWITLVAISEDVMTIDVVSEMTNTRPKTKEKEIQMVRQQIISMGVSNIISGLLGTMGGGSTIGLSIIACFQGSNGRYRITGFVTALTVLFVVLVGHAAISAIPASALVGIIGCTVHHTFEYHSLLIVISSILPQSIRNYLQTNVYKKSMRKIQRADAFVIVLVTFLTLVSNLGIAIVAGLVFSCLVYAWQSANGFKVKTDIVEIQDRNDSDKMKTVKIYYLEGPLFFGNARSIVSEFTPKSDPDNIEIHLHDAQIYDYSAINALNTIAEKYKKYKKSVHLRRVTEKSKKLITKAHHLIVHFTYDTTCALSSSLSLDAPDHHHVEQYPK